MPRAKKAVAERPIIKIDLGCGPHKQDGFIGIDRIAFPGVDKVCNLGCDRWPFADGEVSEGYTSHAVEHLTAIERIHFVNELYRVLIPEGKCTLIVPNWASSRAYGDLTHQWPPVSGWWFFYLKKSWRDTEAPHNDSQHWKQGYTCNFEATWGYGMNPTLIHRNTEFQQFALNNYIEAAWDIHATLTKR
jgi:hypothetical protein